MATIVFEYLHDIPGYRIESEGYRAFICNQMGANCIQFCSSSSSYLRTPNNYEEFKRNPNLYGTPLLFPPNRINHGIYHYNETTYTFPINEVERGHHIHGFLSSTEFIPVDRWYSEEVASITFRYEATTDKPYLTFPHPFVIEISYTLDAHGLKQTIQIANTGTRPMPVGVGFHTTLAESFLPDTEAADYFLKVAVSEEILLDGKTIIPTGFYLADSPLQKKLNKGTYCPYRSLLSNHFISNENSLHTARYTHIPSGQSLTYSTSNHFRFWMLFNGGGSKGFLSVEPQTWIVDAPNSTLSPEKTGFISLEAGKEIIMTTQLQESTAKDSTMIY